MVTRMRVDVLGVQIDALSMDECVDQIVRVVEAHTYLRVVTANPEMIYASAENSRLRSIINSAGLVTADGVGVVWAAKRLGFSAPERVTGIDLLQAIFPVASRKKWKIFFLGSKPGVADSAARKVVESYPGVIWQAAHGYFKTEDEPMLLADIKRFKPDLLLVGLGVPRQEYWLSEHPNLASVSVGVGGSFDALAGLVKRAPQKMRNLHLEWLYRLWQEPWRWKRQSVLPKFVIKVLTEKIFKN